MSETEQDFLKWCTEMVMLKTKERQYRRDGNERTKARRLAHADSQKRDLDWKTQELHTMQALISLQQMGYLNFNR